MSDLSADELRTPDMTYKPDIRSAAFGLSEIGDLYRSIEPFSLTDQVPENIVIQYNTACNLYLYAFNVYRFYNVAEHHALITLEFAIKEFVGIEKLEAFKKERNFSRGLRLCMEYVREQKLVKNSDFSAWWQRNRNYALDQHRLKKITEMKEKHIDAIEINYDEVDSEDFNIEWDYIDMLCENLPNLRNRKAHGSSTLYNQVLFIFDIVSTIINTMYSSKAAS